MIAATNRQQRGPAGMSCADAVAPARQPERPAVAAETAWRDWPGFAQQLEQAIDAGGAALLLLDLLDITDLEGTYGGQAIALLLATTQARLEAVLQRRGGAVIGDGRARFAVFLAGERAPDEVARAAEEFCAATASPIVVLGQALRPAACVGTAQSAPGCSVVALRGQAECALAEARRSGAGMHLPFSAEMQDDIRSRTVLRQALLQAIDDRQFHLQYQPVVRMADRGVVGAEALARWDHPGLGRQSPACFIPAAEATGLIVPLGLQVLEMALDQVRQWRDAGNGAPRVAVNVSGIQLRRPDFAAVVRRALDQAGIAPAALELELTEGALIDSSRQTVAALAELAGIGITLAVDDFGTGYSSLRYLRDLPVHKVKIDQTFVRNIAVDRRDASIDAAVVAMARGLGLTTTAEGVQTEEQYLRLREAGCDLGQGWLFGAPVQSEHFPRLAA
jgi:EAL domain-containing protein (putative c-di-GMP-specific phosphodiesterase class I)/GGDEF domain-containing protein